MIIVCGEGGGTVRVVPSGKAVVVRVSCPHLFQGGFHWKPAPSLSLFLQRMYNR